LDRSLDVQISKLRQRLNADGQNQMLIKAVRNAGYVFAADVVASHD
jgi:DNA-binding response OmpR family regulator